MPDISLEETNVRLAEAHSIRVRGVLLAQNVILAIIAVALILFAALQYLALRAAEDAARDRFFLLNQAIQLEGSRHREDTRGAIEEARKACRAIQ